MTKDLTELLAAAVDERAHTLGAITPAQDALARTRGRIRRRRAVRHTLEGGVGVAAVGVVGAVVWFGARDDKAPTPPATHSSSPSPSPTTPSAPPTPSPTLAIVERAGLPPAYEAPPGLLAQASVGWTLTVYGTRPAVDQELVPLTAHALFAVAPDGTRYHLTDLPLDQGVILESWSPTLDGGLARVAMAPYDSDAFVYGWLDPATGAFTDDYPAGLPGSAFLDSVAPDGVEFWRSYDATPPTLYARVAGQPAREVGPLGADEALVVSPSGAKVATANSSATELVVLTVATGARQSVPLPAANGACHPVGWLDESSLLVQCFDYTGGGPISSWRPRLVRVGLDGATSVLTELGDGQPFVPTHQIGAHVSDGVVVLPGLTLTPELGMADLCADSAWQWGPGGLTLVQGPTARGENDMRVGAGGGRAYVRAAPGCSQGGGAADLTAHLDGQAIVVAPLPVGGPWSSALESWIAAS